MVKFSVCTLSAPAALKPATPQSTAFRMATVPGTRPPISSVRRCKLTSRGDGFKASAITWLTGFCADARATRNTGRNRYTFAIRIRLELEIKSRKSERVKESWVVAEFENEKFSTSRLYSPGTSVCPAPPDSVAYHSGYTQEAFC